MSETYLLHWIQTMRAESPFSIYLTKCSRTIIFSNGSMTPMLRENTPAKRQDIWLHCG